MVEDYWMALARDIPFSQYGSEVVTAAALTDLNKLSDFRGPKVNGKVTAATLFRGPTTGDLTGPYISQFFLLPVSFGTLSVVQKYHTYLGGTDYLTDFAAWLLVQNGQGPFPANDTTPPITYLKNGRDLGAWDHVDFAYQAYLFATQWLLGNKAPFNPGNPLPHNCESGGGANFRSSIHPRSARRGDEPLAEGHVVSEVVRAPNPATLGVWRPSPQYDHGSGKISCAQ